jgi:hypothetical protein
MSEKINVFTKEKETERVIINARTLYKLKSYLTVYDNWDQHRLARVTNGTYARHKCESSEYKEHSDQWVKAKCTTREGQDAIKQFGYKGDTPVTDVVELKYYCVMAYDTVGTFTIHRVMLPVKSYEEYEPDWNEYHYFVSYYSPGTTMFIKTFFSFDEICRHFRSDIQTALQHDQWEKFYNKFNPYVEFISKENDRERTRQRRTWQHHHILDEVIKEHWLKGCPITWNKNGDVTLYDLGGIEEKIFFGEDILKLATIKKKNLKIYDDDDRVKHFNIHIDNPSEFYAEIWNTVEPIKIGIAND